MNYKDRMINILKENMTERGFKLWKGIISIIPNLWNKPSASTGKYHRKHNGEVPSISEHTYHLVYSTVKLFRMFDIHPNTPDADKLLFAASLHDSLKYGILGTRLHTSRTHDKDAADMVSENKNNFEKIMSEEQFFIMEEAIRFHSGRWSTDVLRNENFNFKNYNPETLFIHMLDMMSTADLIQTDVRDC